MRRKGLLLHAHHDDLHAPWGKGTVFGRYVYLGIAWQESVEIFDGEVIY